MFQGFPLPFLPAQRRLDDDVFNLGKKFRALRLQPAQDVGGKLAVVRAGFDDLKFEI
jgi:hypothetical protein